MSAMRQATRSTFVAASLALVAGCGGAIDHAELRAEIGNAPVVLLSTAWCGYCSRLRGDLERWNVAFDEFDVEVSDEGRRAYALVSGRGVPILLIGDKVVHGYSPSRARELLGEAGIDAGRAD